MNRLIQQARLLLAESRYRLPVIFAGFYMAVWLLTRLGLLLFQHALTRNGVGPVLKSLAVGEVFDLVSVLWLAVPMVLFLTLAAGAVVPLAGDARLPLRLDGGRRLLGPVRGGGGVLLLRGVQRPLQLRGGGLPDLPHRGGGQHLAELPHRDHPHRDRPRHGGPALRARPADAGGLAAAGLAVAAPGVPGRLRDGARRGPRWWSRRRWRASRRTGRSTSWRATATTPSGMALLGSDAPYEGLYATRPQTANLARLHRLLAEPAAAAASFAPGSTLRPVQPLNPERRMNVVIVLEESLGSEFIGALYIRRAEGEPDAAVRRADPGRDAAHPRLLDGQPDDPGDRGDHLLAAAAARRVDRAARRSRWTSSPSPSCCGAGATRRCSSTAAGRSSTAWAST